MPAVLWDLDGTLVDSAEYHWASWQEVMNAAGRPITREEFAASFGQRNDRILRHWFGERMADGEVVRIGDAKEVAYRRLMRAGGLQPLAGASDWVRTLRTRGWRQAIASSAPRLNVEAVIDVLGWEGLFDAIVAAEDVTAGKPDPQVFLTAAARLAMPPESCIVVEDAAVGIEAARRAGMRSIGVGGAARNADIGVPSLAELADDAFERLIG